MKKVNNKEKLLSLRNKSNIDNVLGQDADTLLELFYFQKDEFVLYEGLCSDYLYFLAEGQVRIYSSVGNGKNLDHGMYPGNRIIGEAACLWGDEASASVQCMENCYLFGIFLETNRDALLNNVIFLRYICDILREQMRIQKQSSHTMFFPLERRLASLLLQNSENGILQYNLTVCADMLSTSYRHILRVLDSFCRQGLVKKLGRGQYAIQHEKCLEDIAAHTYCAEK
jgi:cAMP-binding proteins - catabolite gene activator and regulatory subunit of cAMP-dependent protein kinases